MSGLIPDNIAHFARALRRAGLPVGPASVVDAVQAVEVGGFARKDDLYWTLHSVFVKRRDHSPVFHEAFHLFFRKRDLIEKMLEILSPVVRGDEREKEKPKAGASRVSDAFFQQNESLQDDMVPEVEVDARFTMSSKDVLREKDFAQMTAQEIADAKRAIQQMVLPVDKLRTRRFHSSNKPVRFDPHHTLRSSLRSGGDLLLPKFKKPREIPPPVVALCDISGSMSQYSRIFLHFLHALSEHNKRVHTFLFGTRLTNVTRQLRAKDPDEALAACSDTVLDWSGGTRIATTVKQFNRDWSRRVLGQGAIVLLITDGLERDGTDDLAHEMDRLHRSCGRLIWLNPLLRFDGFQARAQGIRTMLEHVDEFRAIHSIDSIDALCSLLSEPRRTGHDPRHWLAA